MGGERIPLDANRDTLMNVNALGAPVPSARFMGGREFEMVQQGHTADPTPADITDVLSSSLMILPSVAPLTGPYPAREMQWRGDAPEVGTGRRTAALSFYLAMMTDTCLRLTGATGPTIVEGPFARNTTFLAMLYAVTGRSVMTSKAATGTSIGAALLIAPSDSLVAPDPFSPPPNLSALRDYAAAWRSIVDAG